MNTSWQKGEQELYFGRFSVQELIIFFWSFAVLPVELRQVCGAIDNFYATIPPALLPSYFKLGFTVEVFYDLQVDTSIIHSAIN